MKKLKVKKTYKVYVTYWPSGEYYIGFSGREGIKYEKYFGSSKVIIEEIKKNPKSHGFKKHTIAEFEKKSHARATEHILQWNNRHNPKQLNDMWNVRLRLSYLRELKIPDWKPQALAQTSPQFPDKAPFA